VVFFLFSLIELEDVFNMYQHMIWFTDKTIFELYVIQININIFSRYYCIALTDSKTSIVDRHYSSRQVLEIVSDM